MKLIKHLLTASLTILLFTLVGCSKDSREEIDEAADATASDMKNMLNEASSTFESTWDNVADYTVEQKDAFVSNVEKGYTSLKSKANDLGDSAGDDAKEAFNKAGEDLKAALNKAGEAGEEGWEGTKATVKSAWAELTEAYQNLKSDS